jgi:hypothetical protein
MEWLIIENGEARANEILDDIDRRLVHRLHCQRCGIQLFEVTDPVFRIAAAPLFPDLRRFPHGRRFKQWTGDDSKALMKVINLWQQNKLVV